MVYKRGYVSTPCRGAGWTYTWFVCLLNLNPKILFPLPSQKQSDSSSPKPTDQTAAAPQRSVYTPLSPCHHSYMSCQVELASFSPSCCSTAKNKAPLCRAAKRLQSAPLQGLKLHFLTNTLPVSGATDKTCSDCWRLEPGPSRGFNREVVLTCKCTKPLNPLNITVDTFLQTWLVQTAAKKISGLVRNY